MLCVTGCEDFVLFEDRGVLFKDSLMRHSVI